MSSTGNFYCGNCGEKTLRGAAYCSNCGDIIASGSPLESQEIGSRSKKSRSYVQVKKNHKQKIYYALAGTATIALLIAIFWTNIFVYFSRLTADQDIKRVADGAGFSLQGEYLYFQSNPQLVSADALDTVCPKKKSDSVEFGCYDPALNRIYMLRIKDDDFNTTEYTTAAHEMLHAAWATLPIDERTDVIKRLLKMYESKNNTGKKLRATLAGYGKIDKSTLANEVHSFIGSEIQDKSMSLYLQDYYSKYFDDRRKSVIAQKRFERAIALKVSELEATRRRIKNKSNEIDDFKVNYIDSFESVQQQNLYYGDYYNYNQNVDIYNQNVETYNSMVTNHKDSVNSYNRELEDFRDLMKSLYPSKKLPNYLK